MSLPEDGINENGAKQEPAANPPRRKSFCVADLRGIVPALPGRETVDFDDLIAEAFAESLVER
jgi:hypothetical protein